MLGPARWWHQSHRAKSMRGRVRLGRVTKMLAGRLQPGEVAVVAHEDLDQAAAEALLNAGVGAVLNSRTSLSGRYPAKGAAMLAAAGVLLVDQVQPEPFRVLREGEIISIDGHSGLIVRGEGSVARGRVMTTAAIQRRLQQAQRALPGQLAKFLDNTLHYAQREKDLFFGPLTLPPLQTPLQGRHGLVVVRGAGHRADLQMLAPYIHEQKPVVIAVDGAADAVLAAGWRPHIIIGDMDSASDAALACGAELVVHAYLNGQAPGTSRLASLGQQGVEFTAPGTSEDAALLLAAEGGAQLIVAVGTHTHAVDFLDKGRAGMASTLLTRLKLGGRLVDAKGVSRLYGDQEITKHWSWFLAAAAVSTGLVVLAAPMPRLLLKGLWLRLRVLLGL